MQRIEHLFDLYPWVDVVEADLGEGLAAQTDGRTVWVDRDLRGPAKICAVCHELMHIAVGWLPPDWMPHRAYWLAKVERLVERWTAALLVPAGALTAAASRVGIGPAAAELLCVDEATLAHRLRDLSPRERAELAAAVAAR